MLKLRVSTLNASHTGSDFKIITVSPSHSSNPTLTEHPIESFDSWETSWDGHITLDEDGKLSTHKAIEAPIPTSPPMQSQQHIEFVESHISGDGPIEIYDSCLDILDPWYASAQDAEPTVLPAQSLSEPSNCDQSLDADGEIQTFGEDQPSELYHQPAVDDFADIMGHPPENLTEDPKVHLSVRDRSPELPHLLNSIQPVDSLQPADSLSLSMDVPAENDISLVHKLPELHEQSNSKSTFDEFIDALSTHAEVDLALKNYPVELPIQPNAGSISNSPEYVDAEDTNSRIYELDMSLEPSYPPMPYQISANRDSQDVHEEHAERQISENAVSEVYDLPHPDESTSLHDIPTGHAEDQTFAEDELSELPDQPRSDHPPDERFHDIPATHVENHTDMDAEISPQLPNEHSMSQFLDKPESWASADTFPLGNSPRNEPLVLEVQPNIDVPISASDPWDTPPQYENGPISPGDGSFALSQSSIVVGSDQDDLSLVINAVDDMQEVFPKAQENVNISIDDLPGPFNDYHQSGENGLDDVHYLDGTMSAESDPFDLEGLYDDLQVDTIEDIGDSAIGP